jgi:hypothetical protein
VAKGEINAIRRALLAKATDKFLRVEIAKACGSAFIPSVKWHFLCSIAVYGRWV